MAGARLHEAHELSEGMQIEHNLLGTGIILSIDTSQADARIKVEFENTGEKNLLLKFAKFRIIE